MKRQIKLSTSIGNLYICATENAITHLSWKENSEQYLSSDDSDSFKKIFQSLESELVEYLSGTRQHFTVKVCPEGTEFQKSVWRELQNIPYGKTVCYKDIAKKLGHPKASRAVGAANGKNPISVLIPCHRVIAQDGSLSGYLGGVAIKQKLLNLEDPVRFPQV